MGGKLMVGVCAENRSKTGVAGGDAVDLELEVDTEPREVTVPADFAQVLKANPAVPYYQVEDEESRIQFKLKRYHPTRPSYQRLGFGSLFA
jgi:hypothetical protein